MDIKFDKKTGELTLNPKFNDGTVVVRLNKEESEALIRWCVDKAHDSDGMPSIGPFVVTANLDYSDVDAEQSTPTYHWHAVLPSLEYAKAFKEQVVDELKHTEFDPSLVDIPTVPELHIDIKNSTPFDSLSAAMTSLRIALFEHQSDTVAENEEYWKALGFTEDEAAEIAGTMGDYRWNQKKAEFDPEEFVEFAEKHTSDPALNLRLKRWIGGETIQSLRETR